MLSTDIDFEEFLHSRTIRVRHERFLISPTLGQQIYDEETERLRAQIRAANYDKKAA